jgi:hypothetical protein
VEKLISKKEVEGAEPGKHHAGNGLWLYVTVASEGRPLGSLRWVLRYMLNGRAREMGLGPYPEVSAAHARDKAIDASRLARSGLDPIDERKKEPAQVPVIPTFGEIADEVAADLAEGFRNEKHRAQWKMTLLV